MTKGRSMKPTSKCLLALMVLLVAILACNQSNLKEQRQRKTSPDFQVTANDLVREYNQDRLAADAKYKAKTLAIKGVVDEKMFGNVIFKPGEGVIECFFNDKDRESVRQLKKGAEITVIGYCDGNRDGTVLIVDCALN
jgi:hypothetical protein